MRIDFYNYNGHHDTVNKTLPTAVSLYGDMRQDFDVLRPVITIQQPARPTYNYAYIETLGRYYFVDSVTYVGNKKYEIALSVDVLKTYEVAILEAQGTLRQKDNADKYISNRTSIYDRRPNIERSDFSDAGQLSETGSIVMVTIKGDK